MFQIFSLLPTLDSLACNNLAPFLNKGIWKPLQRRCDLEWIRRWERGEVVPGGEIPLDVGGGGKEWCAGCDKLLGWKVKTRGSISLLSVEMGGSLVCEDCRCNRSLLNTRRERPGGWIAWENHWTLAMRKVHRGLYSLCIKLVAGD